MTIETKYNIGDKVWCANPLKDLFKLTVYGIVAEVIDNKVLVDYKDEMQKYDSGFNEGFLYAAQVVASAN